MAAPSPKPIQPGDKMPDGTIYAGLSPETNKPMYATPAAASLAMTFNEAADYAKNLNNVNYLGHNDWRLPTASELKVLFKNRAAIGGFSVGASGGKGHYRSSSPNLILDFSSWGMELSHRNPAWDFSIHHAAVRPVRSDTQADRKSPTPSLNFAK